MSDYKNVLVMTVKGRPDLTENCLRSLRASLLPEENPWLVFVDGTSDRPSAMPLVIREWYGSDNLQCYWVPNCNIPKGWNYGIDTLKQYYETAAFETFIWTINNDVEFKKPGWLTLLAERLAVPHTGMVGAYTMSVFGLPFATGGVWGFRYDVALQVAEDGKVMDERLHYCCQDVDLSVRIAKAGWTVTHVPNIEFVPDPYVVHAISSTGLTDHTNDELMRLREPERRILIDKHGRNDGRSGYDGVVEGS